MRFQFGSADENSVMMFNVAESYSQILTQS